MLNISQTCLQRQSGSDKEVLDLWFLGEKVGTEDAGNVSLLLLAAFGKDYEEEISTRGMDGSQYKSEVQDRVGLM